MQQKRGHVKQPRFMKRESACSFTSKDDSSTTAGKAMFQMLGVFAEFERGIILPAEGHLFDLLEPEDVVPAWKHWSPILLRPEGLYDTRPAAGGNKAAKLKAIREALRTAKRVWLATDCDREGQLIGQEILEHYKYRGEVMRVLFTAQDSQTIRDAFGRAKPNAEYARLYAAAVARRQADQIYNLSLTRTATVILSRGTRRVIGVGRVPR